MNPILATSTQANLLYVLGGGFVLLGSYFFGHLVRDTFEIPNNESLNQMKIREWFNRELPSDLDPMLQRNGKSLR